MRLRSGVGAGASVSAALVLLGLVSRSSVPSAPAKELGQFESHTDVGRVQHKGTVRFDRERGEYRITGSG